MHKKFIFTAATLIAIFCNKAELRADIISNFDKGAEGWSLVEIKYPIVAPPQLVNSSITPPFQHVISSNNNGYLFRPTDPTIEWYFWSAPGGRNGYLGNQSSALGGTLSFSLFSAAGAYTDDHDVLFVGANGVTLAYDFLTYIPGTTGSSSLPNSPNWVEYTINLDSSNLGRWHRGASGSTYTPYTSALSLSNDMAGVFANLQGLYIRGEYISQWGPNQIDYSGLDKVKMTHQTIFDVDPVPEPASLLMVGIGATFTLIATYRRKKAIAI